MRWAVTVLVFCVASLLALGMVMLYSSCMVGTDKKFPTESGTHFLIVQLLGAGLGLVAAMMAATLDYRHLKKVWWLLFAVAVVLLVAVLIPHVGSSRNGARRWFAFGRFTFQPSEFAKLALLISLAWYIERNRRQMDTLRKGLIIPGLMIGLVVALIFKEPDVGNALVLSAVCGCLLLLGGVRLRYFIPPVLIGALAVGLFIYHNPMRSERVYSWLHIEETKQNKGFQAWGAMVALGSGGVTGQGLGESTQKMGFVPEKHTDFIFSIIGEELGLIATMLVLATFVAILFSGLYISLHAPDLFGLLLGSGITFLISLEALVNIGVVTSALPNKGLPLPFISYGGSNLLLTLSAVGLLLSIARRGRQTIALSKSNENAGEGSNPFVRRGTAAA